MSVNGFVALDLETTGLDENDGEILEIGIALYDLDFKVVEAQSLLVFTPLTFTCIRENLYSDFIMKMHGKSGLLDEIMVYSNMASVRADPVTVSGRIVNQLEIWGVTKKTPMVGSSIGFDRRWLSLHMPEVNDAFSYRSIDVSSDMEYLKTKYPQLWKKIEAEGYQSGNKAKHRVLDDIADSMDLLRRIDKHVYSKAVQ